MQNNNKKKITIVVVILILILFLGAIGVWLAPPYIENLKVRNRYGNMKSWTDYLKKEEASFWQNAYWSGVSGEPNYAPRDGDVAYISNKVYKVHDGLYLVGLRGVSNWKLVLSFYRTQDNFINDEAINAETVHKYQVEIPASEGSAFGSNYDNLAFMGPAFRGYAGDIIYPGPTEIKDNQLEVRIRYAEDGKNFTWEKILTVDVETYPIGKDFDN
jgi:hypothetical protein